VAATSSPGALPAQLLLTRSEIPPLIDREDLIINLYKWAQLDVVERGRSTFGFTMVVGPCFREDGTTLKGFSVRVGDETTIEVRMDDDTTEKWDFLRPNRETGMPEKGGNRTEVLGKFVEVYKVDDKKVSAEGKGAIKKLVQLLAMTIDKYYAFGSVFIDDSG